MRLLYRNGWAYLEISRKKRIALHTKDRDNAEAQKLEAERRVAQAKIDQLDNKPRPESITISKLSNLYCARSSGKKPLSAETLKKDKLTLKLFAEVVDDIPIRNVDHTTVDKFEKACRERGVGDEGMASYLRHLKAAFRWAAEKRQKYIESAPQIDLPRDETEKPLEFRLIEREDVVRLIEKAKELRGERFGVLIDVYASTGCRRREALSLSPQKAVLSGKKAYIDVLGKRNKWRRLYIPPYLRADLKAMLDENPVFQWHPDTVSHWFGEICAALDPPVDARLHDLRHTWITRMLERGVPVHIVQVLAGHSKISTTMKYVHVIEEIRARELEDKIYRKGGRL